MQFIVVVFSVINFRLSFSYAFFFLLSGFVNVVSLSKCLKVLKFQRRLHGVRLQNRHSCIKKYVESSGQFIEGSQDMNTGNMLCTNVRVV